MELYFQLVRLFARNMTILGFVFGMFLAISTNWFVGLVFGILFACLLTLGIPLILWIAGRKNRAAMNTHS